jgi:hypothetical protein
MLLQDHAHTVDSRHISAAMHRLVTLVRQQAPAGGAQPQAQAQARRHTAPSMRGKVQWFITDMVNSWTPEMLAAFSCDDLARVVLAVSRLRLPTLQLRGSRGVPALLQACLAATAQGGCSSVGLRQLLTAAADAEAPLSTPMAAWLQQLLLQQAQQGQLAGWDASHWTLALRAAARLNAPPPAPFGQALWDITARQLGAWKGRQVALVMWAPCGGCMAPPAPWMQAWWVLTVH